MRVFATALLKMLYVTLLWHFLSEVRYKIGKNVYKIWKTPFLILLLTHKFQYGDVAVYVPIITTVLSTFYPTYLNRNLPVLVKTIL